MRVNELEQSQQSEFTWALEPREGKKGNGMPFNIPDFAINYFTKILHSVTDPPIQSGRAPENSASHLVLSANLIKKKHFPRGLFSVLVRPGTLVHGCLGLLPVAAGCRAGNFVATTAKCNSKEGN